MVGFGELYLAFFAFVTRVVMQLRSIYDPNNAVKETRPHRDLQKHNLPL